MEQNLTPEEFDDFKAKIIEEINNFKHEDDPHIIVIAMKGHNLTNISRYGVGCGGFFVQSGIELLITGSNFDHYTDETRKMKDILNQVKDIFNKKP